MVELTTPITITMAQLLELLKGANVLVSDTPKPAPSASTSTSADVNEVAAALTAVKIEPDKKSSNSFPSGPLSVTRRIDAKENDQVQEKPAVALSDGTVFTCTNCSHRNTLFAPADTWYCVTVGARAGIVRGWHFAGPLVTGVSKAIYSKCFSKEAALKAFDAAWNGGVVVALEGFIGVDPTA
ncbi:hypothetical protein DFP72DRAFT_1079526 [Ephemerocybe angulata]|uniref:Uncharacterized protein n=1 Tax=Ephemerocybe angulata TaxID=980116 RepID=A0A8H6HDJ8_9AGAR|nr:hypothetical protein DFP72DRAFT_1079526 [Tulosesus angulatus]